MRELISLIDFTDCVFIALVALCVIAFIGCRKADKKYQEPFECPYDTEDCCLTYTFATEIDCKECPRNKE